MAEWAYARCRPDAFVPAPCHMSSGPATPPRVEG